MRWLWPYAIISNATHPSGKNRYRRKKVEKEDGQILSGKIPIVLADAYLKRLLSIQKTNIGSQGKRL